ncbi:MAG: T9SS type A sorting domain-containing protein [Bacteroidota bacterium]
MKKYIVVILLLSYSYGYGQWDHVFSSYSVEKLAVAGNTIYAASMAGVFYTNNLGETWQSCQGDVSGKYCSEVIATDSLIFVNVFPNKLYRSSDAGITWTLCGPNIGNAWITLLKNNGSVVYCGTDTAGLYVSKDFGEHWSIVNTGIPKKTIYSSMFWNAKYMFIGTGRNGISYSQDGGTTWQAINDNGHFTIVRAMVMVDSNLYAGLADATYRYAMDKKGWTRILGIDVHDMLVYNSLIFQSNGYYVYISEDSGDHWRLCNGGQLGPIYSMVRQNKYIFAAAGLGVWRIPIIMMTGIPGIATEKVLTFDLEQNYPNPFNPSTVIHYTIPNPGVVDLKLFDMLGKELLSLVHEYQERGTHTAVMDLSSSRSLPSGIYFYTLRMNDRVQTKRMVILK